MQKMIGFVLLVMGLAVAMPAPPLVGPEISPASGMNALALIAGGVMMLRASRRK